MKKFIFIFSLFIFYFLLLTINCKAQWEPTSIYYPTGNSFAIKGDTIFAGTGNNGMYLSKNNGSSWVAIDTGLPGPDIFALALKGDTILAGTENGVYFSDNYGRFWLAIDSGIYHDSTGNYYDVDAFALKGDTIFAGTIGDGVYRSSNNCISWDSVNTGLSAAALFVNALAVSENKIFAGTGETFAFSLGVFKSVIGSSNWFYAGLSGEFINALAVKEDTIFAGTNGSGVYFSPDTGHTWTLANTGLSSLTIYSLLIKGNYIFAGTGYGVYVSANNGGNWVAIDEGFPISPADSNLLVQTFYALAANDTYIFAGATSYSGEPGQQAGVWRRPLSQVITGVNEKSNKESNIAVYPNPVSNTLTIDIPQAAVSNIAIYNLLGEEVYSTTNHKLPASRQGGQTTNNIDVSALPSGVYLVKLITANGADVRKFIKE